MASTVPLVVALLSVLFTVAVADDNECQAYISSSGVPHMPIRCGFLQSCCGTCDNRYCCSNPLVFISEDQQERCIFNNHWSIAVGVSVAGAVVMIVMMIICCVCPFCCLYKCFRSRTPMPVLTTTSTVVYPQQPVVPPYQPLASQTPYGAPHAYGGQPMPARPYPAKPYEVGPPPPYQETVGPGYPVPYSQAAYDGGRANYPVQPAPQPGFAQPLPQTDYTATQPAYNPAYKEAAH